MALRDQLERTFCLMRLLSRPEGATLGELEQELGVTRRTVYRDLDALERCGVPLQDDAEALPKRWRLPREFLARLHLQLSLDEVVALAALRAEMGSAAGGAFASTLERLADRLRRALPSRVVEESERWRRRLGRAPEPRPAPVEHPALPSLLCRAIDSGRTLRLDYRSLSSPGREPRVVEPLGLATRSSGLYLVARDVERDEVRKYAVSRIDDAWETGERFACPADFDVEEYFGESFGVFGGEVERVVVRFEASVAPWVRERRWHHSQEVVDLSDGGVELRLRVSGMPEVRSWVQSFGAAAWVVEPERLAREVASEAATVFARALRDDTRRPLSRLGVRAGRKRRTAMED